MHVFQDTSKLTRVNEGSPIILMNYVNMILGRYKAIFWSGTIFTWLKMFHYGEKPLLCVCVFLTVLDLSFTDKLKGKDKL